MAIYSYISIVIKYYKIIKRDKGNIKMSLYAIGILRDRGREIGIRILDTETNSLVDYREEEVKRLITACLISNLSIFNNEIKWKHGSKERYPLINKDKDKIVSVINKDAIIVVGVAYVRGEKVYKAVDYSGKQFTFSNVDLIKHAKKYTIANCKLVKRGTTEYISAIGGNIEELKDIVCYNLDTNTNTLMVYIDFYTSDTLIIPNEINCRSTYNIERIKIIPESKGSSIRKLVLPVVIKAIGAELFTSMDKIEYLECLGEKVEIQDKALQNLKKLKAVSLESVSKIGEYACYNCESLLEFKCNKAIKSIGNYMFFGCKSLNISSVLVEGVEAILNRAFCGNNVLEVLTLPSTLRHINKYAFNGCKHLKTIDCKSDILIGNSYSGRENGLFSGNGDITLYLNKSALLREESLGYNVTIVYRESARDRVINRRIQKLKLLGIEINPNELIEYSEDVISVLKVTNQEELSEAIFDLVREIFKDYPRFKPIVSKIYDFGGLKVNLRISYQYNMKKAKKIKKVDKYIAILGDVITFIPYDKELVINSLRNSGVGLFANLDGVYAPSKNLRSIDIGSDGVIRLVYDDRGVSRVEHLDKFAIRMD